MDSNTSVVTRGLEQPEVLVLVLGLTYLAKRLHALVLLLLQRLEELIELARRQLLVRLKKCDYCADLVEGTQGARRVEVDRHGKR